MVKFGAVSLALVLVATAACSDVDPDASAEASSDESSGPEDETAEDETDAGPPSLVLLHETCEASFDATGPRESQYEQYVRLLDDGSALEFVGDGGAPVVGDYTSDRQDQHKLDREVLLDCILDGVDAPETIRVKLERTRGEDGVQAETVGDYELSWTGPFGLLELLIEG